MSAYHGSLKIARMCSSEKSSLIGDCIIGALGILTDDQPPHFLYLFYPEFLGQILEAEGSTELNGLSLPSWSLGISMPSDP